MRCKQLLHTLLDVLIQEVRCTAWIWSRHNRSRHNWSRHNRLLLMLLLVLCITRGRAPLSGGMCESMRGGFWIGRVRARRRFASTVEMVLSSTMR